MLILVHAGLACFLWEASGDGPTLTVTTTSTALFYDPLVQMYDNDDCSGTPLYEAWIEGKTQRRRF